MSRKLIGKHIFIVEDNTLNRVAYQMVLKRSGAFLEFDRWGKDTMGLMKGFNPDLIVLDLMLPSGQNGYQIFDLIRQDEAYNHVPIVAISASEPAISVPQCKKKGFSGFIAKPFDDSLLPQQFTRLIYGEQVWYMGERYGGELVEESKVDTQTTVAANAAELLEDSPVKPDSEVKNEKQD